MSFFLFLNPGQMLLFFKLCVSVDSSSLWLSDFVFGNLTSFWLLSPSFLLCLFSLHIIRWSLPVLPRLALNSWSSCVSFLSSWNYKCVSPCSAGELVSLHCSVLNWSWIWVCLVSEASVNCLSCGFKGDWKFVFDLDFKKLQFIKWNFFIYRKSVQKMKGKKPVHKPFLMVSKE
jgi:hypothetical protein